MSSILAAAALVAVAGADLSFAQAPRPGVERLYIIDCGTFIGPDKSRWTPGVDIGKPLPMVGNCYLIHHAPGWMVSHPDGKA